MHADKEYSTLKKKLFCFVGIFFSYLFYGVLQEKITKSDYTVSVSNNLYQTYRSEKFKFFFSLILVQCVFNCFFALIFGLHSDRIIFRVDRTSKWLYFFSAASYSGAMIASNSCLTYLNYPTQVIGKSIKPIPILLMTFILGNVNYSYKKFINVCLITFGVILFMFKKPIDIFSMYSIDLDYISSYLLSLVPKNVQFSSLIPNSDSLSELIDKIPSLSFFSTKFLDFATLTSSILGPGEILLLTSLFLDGVTATFQEKMRKHYNTSSYPLMFYTNLFSCLLLFIVVLINNELFEFISFCSRHPYLMYDIILFSLTSAVGQTFIFYAVTKISPLECSIITTTRKFFTILISVLVFKNSLLEHQWVGVVLVFFGLGADAYQEKSGKNKVDTANLKQNISSKSDKIQDRSLNSSRNSQTKTKSKIKVN